MKPPAALIFMSSHYHNVSSSFISQTLLRLELNYDNQNLSYLKPPRGPGVCVCVCMEGGCSWLIILIFSNTSGGFSSRLLSVIILIS